MSKKKDRTDVYLAVIEHNIKNKNDCVLVFTEEYMMLKTGQIEKVVFKNTSDCFAESLNGKPLPKNILDSKQILK